jgi:hypothetical protein
MAGITATTALPLDVRQIPVPRFGPYAKRFRRTCIVFPGTKRLSKNTSDIEMGHV